MSEIKASAEETINEFVNSIDDIRDFVIASKKRALDNTQLKVIIKNKIQRIKSTYNNLISHTTLDSETRSKAFFDSIPKLINVINSIGHDGVFELIWLELNAIINSFAASLIAIHSKGDVWSVQGSATLLVQIIGGIPKIEHLPTLTDRSPEDPEYLDRWIVSFNCIQFSAATFSGVIYAVKTVQLSDLIYWSNQAFFYFSLLEEFLRIFEWEKIAKVMKNRPQLFFINVFTFVISLQNLIEHVLVLMKRIGSSWPKEIISYGLLDDHSFEGILSLIKQVRNYATTALNKLEDLFKLGMWSLNDNPMQSDAVKNIIELDKYYDYYTAYVTALKETIPFNESNRFNKSLQEQISNALILNNWVLTNIENQVGERKVLLDSFLGSQYVDVVVQRLELISIECFYSDSIISVKDHFEQLNWLFHSADPLQFSDLFLRKLFVELFINTKIDILTPFEDLFNEIIRLKELLHFRPRDITALIVLELILGILLNKRELATKEEIFIIINKHGLISGGDYHLYTEFQDYIDFLLHSFKGGPSFLTEQLLSRKTSINAFDSTTWLIPDFNKPFASKFKIPIYYLPFNRSSDGIIGMK